ncbi:MAG: TonB-dependent receptor [bacterium]|nr:TonB-dependent receptor [bacterium]
MKSNRAFIFAAVVILLMSVAGYSQSKETGALTGTITLDDGNPVPGVLVSLSSETVMGMNKTTISNDAGNYRFLGLQPGEYVVIAKLEGFASAKQSGVKVKVGKTLTVSLTLKQGKITEEIEVMGKPPLVDIKDSSTASVELSTEFLQNIPNSQFAPDAINLAPGVSMDVAYGAASGTGIAYQIDGVDVSDPEAGTAWVFLDYNVVEEVSVSGIGAPAEYGGFTGIVFNTVTKSGSNNLKGYTEFLFQGESWNSTNSSDANLSPGSVKFYSGHFDIGGPLIKDKLTYFASLLYHRETEALSGTDFSQDYKQPKSFLKFSWQPTTKSRLHMFMEYDSYDGTGRGGDAQTTESATVDQESPEFVGNISLHHLISDYTFMEAKLAYFTGYYDLVPHSGADLSGHVDAFTGDNTVNSAWFYRGDRSRLQANASVTHHADNFMGSHDFKFGAEFIHVTQRDRYGFTNGRYYLDYQGAPYYMYEYEGYDISASLNTVSVYVQDSWSVTDRLTLNPGVRIDMARGGVDDVSGNQYKPKTSFAPRLGFTFDIFGDHSTALKGHWGRYYESPYVATFRSLSNSRSDFNIYFHDGTQFVLDTSIPAGTTQYRMDDNLKQTYMEQLTFGIERELVKDLSLGVTFIQRKNHDHIAPVDIAGVYVQGQYTNSATGQTYTVWDQVNGREDSIFLITNPRAGDYPIVLFTPYRKYTGLEILLNKRFSDKWQLMASYVYGKSTGNFDNTFRSGSAGGSNNTFRFPNMQINADGRLSNDPTHMLKIQGSAVLPYGIQFNVNFALITGNTYNMEARLPGSVDSNNTDILLEPRGSHRYPTSTNLDIRLEKTFRLGGSKIGVLLDVFNLFNEGVVTEYDTVDTNFEEVLTIKTPRAFRAGLRFWF